MKSISKDILFKRQTTLPEIGKEGQKRLQQAKVLVVGCGGLGSPVAVYLASSGVGIIHLVDFDKVMAANLHRQIFYSLEDIGKYKSKVLASFIRQRAPYTEVSFSTEVLTKSNAIELISNVDIVVDGTDSLPTKYLLNDVCVLQNKPLVYGSLYKFDGYVSTFNVAQGKGRYSANLRDAFPEMNVAVPNCEEAGTLNAIVGMIATAQVNEVLKIITKTGKPLVNELLIYNAQQNTQLKMKLTPGVPKEKIAAIFKTQTYFDPTCGNRNPDWQISPEELKEILADTRRSQQVNLIAVLSDLKLPFSVHQTIPIREFDANTLEVDFEKTYVMVCQRGLNSYKAMVQLKEKYPGLNVLNLTGGISAYL
ncbi:MAG: molybdopterin biosynthesis protein MoeB [Flavobacteriaceae bacterium]|nr:MAG: molybdopterin biosynthesis protein MoeB [Flavobacteriaceae bacterium]